MSRYRIFLGLLLAGVIVLGASFVDAQSSKPAKPLLVTGRIVQPEAVRVTGKDVARFTLLRGETPQQHYPPAAKQAGIGGMVLVDLLLNDQGQVLEAQVISESPAGKGFGLAALDTAKTFEFANPLGRLVLMSVTVKFLP